MIGGAFHAAKATYYRTKGDLDEALEAVDQFFDDESIELEEESQRATLIRRTRSMMSSWAGSHGFKDFRRYEILGIEKYVEVPVPGLPSFVFTGRLDLLVRDRETKLVSILDSKTSGYSITLTADGVLYGDQATAYVWLGSELLGERISSFIPDITYWSRNSTDVSKILNSRPIVVLRTDEDVVGFKLGIAQLFSEIAQKTAALSQGSDPRQLFRRNTHYCISYGHVCEFADECRSRRILRGESSSLFKKGKGHPLGDLGKHVTDRMAI